jgi:hypothetical protein
MLYRFLSPKNAMITLGYGCNVSVEESVPTVIGYSRLWKIVSSTSSFSHSNSPMSLEEEMRKLLRYFS